MTLPVHLTCTIISMGMQSGSDNTYMHMVNCLINTEAIWLHTSDTGLAPE